MTNQLNASVGCQLVADYVDEAECLPNGPFVLGEPVRPTVVMESLDFWGRDDGLREFSVLLRDGRVIAVRGHGLKHEPHPIAGQDIFGIVVHTEKEEVFVALFKGADVAGIFYGDLRTERKIA